MGREISISLRRNSHIVYQDYVCGRDSATGYIANLIDMKVSMSNENKDDLSDEEIEKLYSLVYSSKLEDSDKITKEILEPLQKYKDEDYKEINKAKNELSALDEARRNCGIYEEFMKFTEAMVQVQNWLDEEDYSRAAIMLEIIYKCRSIAERNENYASEIWITLSE